MKGSCVVCDLRDREKMMAVRRGGGSGFNRITMVYVLLLLSYTFLKRRLICAKSTFILCLYKYVKRITGSSLFGFCISQK